VVMVVMVLAIVLATGLCTLPNPATARRSCICSA
jgi:hypothetical protein